MTDLKDRLRALGYRLQPVLMALFLLHASFFSRTTRDLHQFLESHNPPRVAVFAGIALVVATMLAHARYWKGRPILPLGSRGGRR